MAPLVRYMAGYLFTSLPRLLGWAGAPLPDLVSVLPRVARVEVQSPATNPGLIWIIRGFNGDLPGTVEAEPPGGSCRHT